MLQPLMSMLLAGAVVAGSAGGIDAVRSTELEDQHGNSDSLAAHRGEVVVVMVVTARRLRNLKPWERELRERFDRLVYLRIADVPSDSPADTESVAAKLQERVPDDVSVLIDMERIWATALDLDTDRPNLLLIDRDGELVTSIRGLCVPELVQPLVNRTADLLEQP